MTMVALATALVVVVSLSIARVATVALVLTSRRKPPAP
jgi:hypothetical protein